MWPEEINPKNGTLYMEIGGRKIKLTKIGFVRLEVCERKKRKSKLWYQSKFLIYDNKSWRKRLWFVWTEGAAFKGLKRFSNRNAAIMWLKRYGIDFVAYRLNGELVCVVSNKVYFYSREHGLGICAESKRTHPYATRNN